MSDASIRFTTTLLKTGQTTTGIVVPPEIITQLDAGARPQVVAKVNSYTYRTTVGVMRGESMLPFSAEHRAGSGLLGGEVVTVELSLDRASREVEIPADLSAALDAAPPAMAAFLKQAPSRRKADVTLVLSSKATETRNRRIAAIVERLRG